MRALSAHALHRASGALFKEKAMSWTEPFKQKAMSLLGRVQELFPTADLEFTKSASTLLMLLTTAQVEAALQSQDALVECVQEHAELASRVRRARPRRQLVQDLFPNESSEFYITAASLLWTVPDDELDSFREEPSLLLQHIERCLPEV